MDATRRFTLGSATVAVVAVGHALATWPLDRTVALFVGGAAIAVVLEVLGTGAGLVRHEMRPRVLGVPVVVVAAWPATVYVWYRVALLALPAGVEAAALGAVLATASDAVMEPGAVAEGVWTYPEHPLSSPRLRGVPWWNAAAWLAIGFSTAMAPTWLA